MEIAQAHYLVNSSNAAFVGGKRVPLPTIMDILPMRIEGESAIMADGESIVFSMDRQDAMDECLASHLFKNPEKVAGKYPRYEYNFALFIGDADGAFVAESHDDMQSHGDLVSWLMDHRCIDREYKVIGAEAGITKVGNPRTIHYLYSGIILPRQDAPRRPAEKKKSLWQRPGGTYMSFWSVLAFCMPLKEVIVDFACERYEGPFFFDTNTSGDISSKKFEVQPLQ
jgi:hypothetical protein